MSSFHRTMLATTLLLILFPLPLIHAYALPGEDMRSNMAIINNKGRVQLDPSVQHIPLNPAQSHLRWPPAQIPSTFDIFVGLSVFRDGYRCAKTVFTGFLRATHPDRIHFGIVDQLLHTDVKCIDEYCKMAAVEWPEHGPCRYRNQIVIDEWDAIDSRGPTLARHYQQQLIQQEEFCLQLDGHSIFTNDWDTHYITEFKRINNEMAVLSTYLHHIHDFVGEKGENRVPTSLPHLCTTIRGSNGLVRNEGASMISNSKFPQLSALWGAGLSFSKCHAEKRAPIDPHTLWMFDGEEFLRSSHLWTHGYDLYSPSHVGSVVYHNYSKVPARFEHVQVDHGLKALETERGKNRFHLLVGTPFKGEVDAEELQQYGFGTVRTFSQYLEFSGVTFEKNKNDTHTCKQLHWVPYTNPIEIETLVSGWKMNRNTAAPAHHQGPDGADTQPTVDPQPKQPKEERKDPIVHKQEVKSNQKQEEEESVPSKKTKATVTIGAFIYLILFASVAMIVVKQTRDEKPHYSP